MVYFLNIKNSYPRFLCLDNSACVKSYFSCGHRFGDNGFSINIENIEVNIDEKEWYEPIVMFHLKAPLRHQKHYD